MLLEEGMNINVVLLPEGEDPDSYAQSHSTEEVEEYIKNNKVDFIKFKTNLLMSEVGDDPQNRARLIGDIVRSIAVIPNDILRSEYMRKSSEMLQVSEQLLVSETAKIRIKHAEENYKHKQQENTATENSVSSNQTELVQEATNETLPQPTIHVGRDENPLYNKERAIIQFILRNGEKLLLVPENKISNITSFTESVISHIYYSLNGDGIEFLHPLYKRIFEEAVERVSDDGFIAEQYFLSHPDAEISHLTAELCSDRYILSKLFCENNNEERNESAVLFEQATRLTIAYKQSIVDDLLKQTMAQLKDPAITADSARCMQVMQELKYLKETQQALNALLAQYGFGSAALNF